jgi:hypothetical protein
MIEDPLPRVREICLALPEVVETADNEMVRPSFRVRGKSFGMYMDNHHGDGRVGLWCKAPPGVQSALVSSDPERFYVPPYVGPSGWVGIRFDLKEADWDEVADLIEQGYRMSAPKRLIALLDQG